MGDERPESAFNKGVGYAVGYGSGRQTGSHVIIMGSDRAPSSTSADGPALSAQDAAILDKKADDGLPDTGTLTAGQGINSGGGGMGGCLGATYSKSNTTVNCLLYFKLD